MVGSLLAQIGLPALLKTVTSALDGLSNPIAKTAADALRAVNNAVDQGAISSDDIKESNRHIETMANLDSGEIKAQIDQINESLRAEIASSDIYVRRMRPTFGYIIAFTWAAQMLAIAALIVENPEKSGVVMNAMSNLDAIWTVGLSVLGIYVYKRSNEKMK